MDDLREEIHAAVSAMFADRRDRAHPADGFDRDAWKNLCRGGFHLLGVPEEVGGSGGSLTDLAAVVDASAFHSVRLPLVETTFLAGWLADTAELPLPEGLVVASLDEGRGERRDGELRLSGTLQVPWGRHADHVVSTVRCGREVLLVVLTVNTLDSRAARLVRDRNLAGEPRDTLILEDAVLHGSPAVVAPPGVDAEALLRRGALARAVQLAAAARAVLEATRRHVAEREQFGRPLVRFQAVQQQLAKLAAETAAMRVSADAALLAVQEEAADADLAVAAAKATTSAAAREVASIGHQLHGAMGYAQEHHLGASTTRLWAWREEFGSESHWHDAIASLVRASGAWWPLMTGDPR